MDREQIGSVLAGALEDHNDGYEGCTMCGPWFTCDVKLVLNEVPDLLAAIDELEDEHATEVNRLRACWEEMRAEKDAAHVRIAELTEILASSREARIQLGKDLDELEARNAKLEAVARDDVRDMANFCIAQGASKPWQEIARRLLAALDALDG